MSCEADSLPPIANSDWPKRVRHRTIPATAKTASAIQTGSWSPRKASRPSVVNAEPALDRGHVGTLVRERQHEAADPEQARERDDERREPRPCR
jgi:hypothetical protein